MSHKRYMSYRFLIYSAYEHPRCSGMGKAQRLFSTRKHLISTQTAVQHYTDVIMGEAVFQITSLTIVYSIVYSGADQRKHQSSASLALVRGIHRRPVNFPHKWPETRKMFPFNDVIMKKKQSLHFKPLLPTLHSCYHGGLWCGKAMIQGIGTRGFDLVC